jgi:hypothetical protein
VIKLILKLLGKILSILGITSDSILDKIFNKKKMAKKTITPIQDNQVEKQISSNTQIVFTIKSFLATIGTILGLFYGFYQLVVVPKVNKTEEHYETMFNDQKEQNRIFYQELGNINSSIGALGASVNALNNNKSYVQSQQTIPNTGGSFGGATANR